MTAQKALERDNARPEGIELVKVGKNMNKPVFDWDNISFGESGQAGVIAARLQGALDAHDATGYEAAVDALAALLARYLVSVPRAWCVTDAPTEIDWSQPDSVKRFVKASKTTALLQAFNAPEDAAGESGPG